MPKLRLGIVGVGRHGSRYARHAANDVDGIELAAVCRRNEAEGRPIAEELGCEFTNDALALAERKDIDALVLVTVPSLLEPVVERAAATGKRLLIEKPVAPDRPTGERMLATLEASGAFCMAGQTLRFNTVANAIRDRIGELGRLDSLIFSQRFPPQLQLDWLDDPERSGGGNILHTGVHCFDLIRFMTGLDPVWATCTTRSVYTKQTEDAFVSNLELAAPGERRGGWTLAMVSCSRTTQTRNGLIEVTGENGQLVGDHVLGSLYAIGPDGKRELEAGAPRHTVLAALEAFAEDVAADRAPRIAYADGLAAVATAEACYTSARSGRREPVVMPKT